MDESATANIVQSVPVSTETAHDGARKKCRWRKSRRRCVK